MNCIKNTPGVKFTPSASMVSFSLTVLIPAYITLVRALMVNASLMARGIVVYTEVIVVNVKESARARGKVRYWLLTEAI